jgi:predicted house-cleaning noncanonical NTP pyrophosphatase (MazG superfamily)
MLTLKQCKEILSEEAKGLTDNEILEMRDWLSVFAELIIESTDFSNLPVNKIRKKKTNERKSDHLHKGVNGRAEQRIQSI